MAVVSFQKVLVFFFFNQKTRLIFQAVYFLLYKFKGIIKSMPHLDPLKF